MTAEECQALMHRVGGSTGERAVATAAGVRYRVDGANGENAIQAVAARSADAWLQAVEQAASLGMLGRNHLRKLGADRG
jgi:hypothetical protein